MEQEQTKAEAPAPAKQTSPRRGRAPVRRFVSPVEVRRRGAAGLDPVLTRDSATSHKGVLVLVALCALFVAYAVDAGGVKTQVDGFLNQADDLAHAHTETFTSAVADALPYAAAVTVGLLSYAFYRRLRRRARLRRRSRWLRGRKAVAVEQFCSEALVYGISVRASREAYRLLAPRYGRVMRAQLGDRLVRDLQMKPHRVAELYAGVVQRVDRSLLAADMVAKCETVLELLKAVERSPSRAAGPQSVCRTGMDVPQDCFIRPVRMAERPEVIC